MPTPAISVLLPCYNAQATLADALESIRSQTFEDWELIVVDDGSTDDSLAIARGLAREDGRVRVHATPHGGIVKALVAASAEARAPFLARMDADDLAHAERLAKQMQCMADDARIGICGTQVRMTGGPIGYGRRRYERWINALVAHEDMMRGLFVECPIPHPTFLLRREAFDQVGGYQDRGWAEDYDLCMRLFGAGVRFGKVAEPLLDWTESPARLSMTSPRYSPERFRALKRHYLFRTYLRGHDRFYQWGAGEVGKRWLREWPERRPEAVVDIHPRKIGRTIHGTPVIAPDDLPGPGHGYVVVAVGAANARDDIRAKMRPRGYRELEHYVFLA